MENKTNELTKPFLCYSKVLQAIFTGEDNLMAKMVADITGIDYEMLKDNVILLAGDSTIKNNKAKRCDFVIRILDNNIINLEFNVNSYGCLIIKDLSYLCQLFTNLFNVNDKYHDDLIIAQINISCFDDDFSKPLSKYVLNEKNIHKLYVKNISIFDLNVVKCYGYYYKLINKDNIPNFIRWGVLIYCKNFKDIPNILNGIMTDDEKDRFMDKINILIQNDLFISKLGHK